MITATGERLGFSGIKVALTRGCLHRLDPRAAAPRRKPVLLPLAIMLPEDTFALTEHAQGQQRMAQPCRCSHAHACVVRQTTLKLTRGHKLQSRILLSSFDSWKEEGIGFLEWHQTPSRSTRLP